MSALAGKIGRSYRFTRARALTFLLPMRPFNYILIVIVAQTVFPKISSEMNMSFIWKMFKLILIPCLFIYVFVFISAPIVVNILGGPGMYQAASVLRLLAVTVPIISMSVVFGTYLLIPFGYAKQFTGVAVFAAFVYLSLFGLLLLCRSLTLYPITLISVLTEIYIATHLFIICKNKRIW